MTATNMPQRSAHNSQYSPNAIEQTTAQMIKVRRVLFAVPAILLFTLIFLSISTYISKQNNQIKISPDNYHTLVMSQPVKITKQLLATGEKAQKNQPLLALEVQYGQANSANLNFNAPDTGYFFHAKNTNHITKANQPIGYLLKKSDVNEFSFLIKN